jgi:hypothetical protein
VKRENCNLSKIAKKMPKNECKNHWIFDAHNFFQTFSKCRLTYGLILPVFCDHSSLLIPWLQCLEKRSVRMSWPHKTGLFDCSMPKSWCKSVRTTKWTLFHLIYRRDFFHWWISTAASSPAIAIAANDAWCVRNVLCLTARQHTEHTRHRSSSGESNPGIHFLDSL